MWKKFNPTVRDFLAKHKDKTLLGLAWALYWRLWLFFLSIYIVSVVLVALFSFVVKGS